MEWTGLNELREKFLSFYESKGHLRLPSFSLIPQGDKSLLLINAGMSPMKKIFYGRDHPAENESYYMSEMYQNARYRECRKNRASRNIF